MEGCTLGRDVGSADGWPEGCFDGWQLGRKLGSADG
jgi:hypothetical protein